MIIIDSALYDALKYVASALIFKMIENLYPLVSSSTITMPQ